MQQFSLEWGLSRVQATLADAVQKIARSDRVDLTGLPAGAAGLLFARFAAGPVGLHGDSAGYSLVVVVSTNDEALKLASDIRFFLASADDESSVLVYPEAEVTPFVEVAQDRALSMERLATLTHLAIGSPFRVLVVSSPALLRRVPPRTALATRALSLQTGQAWDRDTLLQSFVKAGYTRVPVVEDPGTFAVRGAIVDVYGPTSRYPIRIEFDDDVVVQIRSFHSETQKTVGSHERTMLPPVREAPLFGDEFDRAQKNIRDLCDEANLPSSRTRVLLENLELGRTLNGVEVFLPAFYESLETFVDYLPSHTGFAVLDPTDVRKTLVAGKEQVERDFQARKAAGSPTYPLEAFYTTAEEVSDWLKRSRVVAIHRIAVAGSSDDDEAEPLSWLESVNPGSVLELGGEDHAPLVAALRSQREKRGKQDALEPLVHLLTSWSDSGLRVVFAARTRTQSERLVSLLRSYQIDVAFLEAPFGLRLLDTLQPGSIAVTIGALTRGFTLVSEALSCVTEEEIFGARAHRQRSESKESKKRRAFLDDLRELSIGDYVIHHNHGVGRYLGLEHKAVLPSKFEEMQGKTALSVEVLVVEYAGGDKLYLPIGRLNQIEKYGGQQGDKPKLDRLGGQTFARTKARVRESVQRLADDLLRLYAQRETVQRPPLGEPDRMYSEFEAAFPFDETPDQARAIEEVLDDLERPRPMDRVVCGDVGFGKTEVALRAGFRTASSGRQVALLCPTTVLAQQHYSTFRERFRDYPLTVRVLSRFVDKKRQAEVLASLKNGTCDVVVGTHRLLSKDVHFRSLGLLIVDEEQRFGVAHKERLKRLRGEVDVLTLSATPIPRTLQLAVGGLRDLSLITTPPPDRRAVRTLVMRWDDHLIREALERELGRSGQVFFVYNRIEGLYERAQRLAELVPRARIAVAHGQMKEAALEKVMTDFVNGEYDVLCSTAIIENGLDIPRANTIFIDRADLFGLAQLYQLRGRVGRSRERAYCYLIAPPPDKMTDEARSRIEALERFTKLGSGFHVATLDMELRGVGDLLGADQSGHVAAVGYDLFLRMLEEAVATLRGEVVRPEVDPEITLDLDHYIPEAYIDDVGLRLSFYKRLASAEDSTGVQDIAAEMEDRFGPPPVEALTLIHAMSLKPALRSLRAVGCEASKDRVTFHLLDDTPLDPAKLMQLVSAQRSTWKLTPERKLVRRFRGATGNTLSHLEEAIRELEKCVASAYSN